MLPRARGTRRSGRRLYHQLIPPSRSDSISSRSRLYVPADRYFHPPSGSSATIEPDVAVRDEVLRVEQRRVEDLRHEALVERPQALDLLPGEWLGGNNPHRTVFAH